MTAANETFVELHIYEQVAEQTGATEEWSSVRMRRGVCRSVTELRAKSRRLGDGYYYIAASAWPDGVSRLNLADAPRTPFTG